jgi:hypothetical protein
MLARWPIQPHRGRHIMIVFSQHNVIDLLLSLQNQTVELQSGLTHVRDNPQVMRSMTKRTHASCSVLSSVHNVKRHLIAQFNQLSTLFCSIYWWHKRTRRLVVISYNRIDICTTIRRSQTRPRLVTQVILVWCVHTDQQWWLRDCIIGSVKIIVIKDSIWDVHIT